MPVITDLNIGKDIMVVSVASGTIPTQDISHGARAAAGSGNATAQVGGNVLMGLWGAGTTFASANIASHPRLAA